MGDHIGRYQLLEEVGRGAGGVVHRALDPTLQRTVAIKLLHEGGDAVTLGRFAREARTAATVRHEGLVQVLDAGQLPDGRPWIAMEWVEGESLRARLKREGRVAGREVARLGAAIARGLAEVHAAGLVHRDVKAENILVGTDGAPRLSDFGVVGLRAPSGGRLTRTGELVGTPAAMAPEQANSEREVGPPADVWALGVLLHELLSGRAPFARSSVLATLEAVLTAEPPPLGRDVDPTLAALVRRMLDRDPARRGTAAEHASALDACAGPARTSRRRRRPGRTLRLAAGALLAAAGLAVTALLVPRRPGSVAGPGPAPVASAPPRQAEVAPAPLQPARPLPAWFRTLPDRDRPPAIPTGVELTDTRGEYLHVSTQAVLCWIPPGRFEWADEGGRRQVRLTRGVFFGRDELTLGQLERYLASRGEQLPARRPPLGTPAAVLPWFSVQGWCRWAGARLPTEAEWQRAAVGDDGRRYPWGQAPRELLDLPVPSLEPDGCAFGLRAMGGGVAEWMQDVLAPLPVGGPELVDPRATSADAPGRDVRRVLRGGAAGLDPQLTQNVARVGLGLVAEGPDEMLLFGRAGLRFVVDAGASPYPIPPPVRWRVTAWAFPPYPTASPVPDPPPLDALVPRGAPQLGPVLRDGLELDFGDRGPGQLLLDVSDPTFPVDGFALRAEAAPVLEPGKYLVHTRSDDGVAVWVDGVQVISRWTHHHVAEDMASFVVEARREVRLRVDYCELFGWGCLSVELLPD